MANGNESGGPAAASSSPGYDGRSGEIGKLALKIGLLNLVTLSFYRFWGKTRLRGYIWSRLSFEGERLEYTGRGGELFIGFLIALAILIPLIVAYGVLDLYLAGISEVAQSIASLLYVLGFAFLFNVALYRGATLSPEPHRLAWHTGGPDRLVLVLCAQGDRLDLHHLHHARTRPAGTEHPAAENSQRKYLVRKCAHEV